MFYRTDGQRTDGSYPETYFLRRGFFAGGGKQTRSTVNGEETMGTTHTVTAVRSRRPAGVQLKDQ